MNYLLLYSSPRRDDIVTRSRSFLPFRPLIIIENCINNGTDVIAIFEILNYVLVGNRVSVMQTRAREKYELNIDVYYDNNIISLENKKYDYIIKTAYFIGKIDTRSVGEL